MGESKNIIVVQELTKRFGNLVAVDNVDFSVKEGEIFSFLGPNGAGKSTTIKMLTTLLRPDSGKIILNGYNPVVEQDKARKSFGIVFQDPSLDDELTAYENLHFHAVLYGLNKNTYKKKIEELLNMVELWNKKDTLVKTFSGGMKRRLEIARGLLHHPKILFMDEPTLGLDPQTRNHIWTYIKKLNKEENITVFFTTHYMEEVEKMANTVAIIDSGKIISTGSVENIKISQKATSLEEAFLALTGKVIREEPPAKNNFIHPRRK
jgi:ABC-2 type transport system ATP-binding protein